MASQNGAGGRLLPNLDLESTRAHNLTVLQRSDPSIEEILFTAAHVTLYDFNIELSQWSRKDVEGPLFVIKRNTQPGFQFIVMNRRNAANLVENLLGDFEYELQVPYLLYRNASQEVNGIWFYNSPECEAVANLFSRIIGAFSKVSTVPNASLNSRSELEESDASLRVAMGECTLGASASSTVTSSPENSSGAFWNGSGSIPMGPVQQKQIITPASLPMQGQPLGSARVPALQTPAPVTVSTSRAPVVDTSDSTTVVNGNHIPNLVKPSLFTSPATCSPLVMAQMQSSSIQVASTLQTSVTQQQQSASSLLHPFPPPVLSAQLNPASSYGPAITKDKVRDALLRLAQNDQFVDIVYMEILNAHHS